MNRKKAIETLALQSAASAVQGLFPQPRLCFHLRILASDVSIKGPDSVHVFS
jgi:hypothetical protein